MAVEQLNRVNQEATLQNKAANRSWLESLKPYTPPKETLQSSSNETVVFKQDNKSRARQWIGTGMEWGGGIYGVYQLLTLDLGGALAGGVVFVAGKWVKPNKN